MADADVFSLGLDLDAMDTAGGATLADVFVALVRKSQCDVVLVIEQVWLQHVQLRETLRAPGSRAASPG